MRMDVTPRVGLVAAIGAAAPLLAGANGVPLPIATDIATWIPWLGVIAGPVLGYMATMGFRGAAAWFRAGADEQERKALEELARADPKDAAAIDRAKDKLAAARRQRALAGVLDDVRIPIGQMAALQAPPPPMLPPASAKAPSGQPNAAGFGFSEPVVVEPPLQNPALTPPPGATPNPSPSSIEEAVQRATTPPAVPK